MGEELGTGEEAGSQQEAVPSLGQPREKAWTATRGQVITQGEGGRWQVERMAWWRPAAIPSWDVLESALTPSVACSFLLEPSIKGPVSSLSPSSPKTPS